VAVHCKKKMQKSVPKLHFPTPPASHFLAIQTPMAPWFRVSCFGFPAKGRHLGLFCQIDSLPTKSASAEIGDDGGQKIDHLPRVPRPSAIRMGK
jgi:hypothetical protein